MKNAQSTIYLGTNLGIYKKMIIYISAPSSIHTTRILDYSTYCAIIVTCNGETIMVVLVVSIIVVEVSYNKQQAKQKIFFPMNDHYSVLNLMNPFFYFPMMQQRK